MTRTIRSRSSRLRELDRHRALAAPELDPDPGLEPVGEPAGQLVQPGGRRAPRALVRGPAGAVVATERDDLLDRAHRQALGDDPLGQPLLRVGVVEAEQRPGVPGGQHAGGDPALHRRRAAAAAGCVLEICGRDRPIRCASSSWVQPKSSSSCS